MRQALKGRDAVVSALGTSASPFREVTLLSTATRALVSAMKIEQVSRLVCITGIGAGDSAGHGGFLFDNLIFPLLLRNVYADKNRQEAIVRESGLDWVLVRPSMLNDKPGRDSIRALTPTLALLNVRLGFWLKNPRYAERGGEGRPRPSPFYLWSEISGRLYENSDAVYLTDGGHIENLGIYELLRRRCRVIIAVDAEADAPMNFSSLVTLQRYARIDLGILIDLPWSPIRNCTLGWMACNAGKPPTPAPEASHGGGAAHD